MEPTNTVPVAPPKRGLFGRIIRALAKLALAIALLLGVSVLMLNWLGKRAYENGRKLDESHGELYNYEKLLPVAVPDDQNMAMTPMLAPLLDYTRQNGHTVWRQPGVVPRMQSSQFFSTIQDGTKGPEVGNWEIQNRTDLKLWQEYYRQEDTFDLPAKQGAAADDVLAALDRYRTQRAELVEASQRIHSHFPVRKHVAEGFEMLLPHLAIAKKITVALRLHAIAALEAGKPDAAMEDLRVVFRLLEAMRNEPIIISHLVNIACNAIIMQPVWEGLATGRWQPDQLKAIQQNFTEINQFSGLSASLRGERACVNTGVLRFLDDRQSFDITSMLLGDEVAHNRPKLSRFVPSGFLYFNLARLNDCYRENIRLAADAEAGTGGTRTDFAAYSRNFEARLSQARKWDEFLIRTMLPALAKLEGKSRRSQATLNLAITACALERYKLTEGKYPASLADLTPRYMARPLRDPMNGQPLHYAPEAGGSFQLYSVGIDGVDGGGMVNYNKKRTGVDPDHGDIVWAYKTEE